LTESSSNISIIDFWFWQANAMFKDDRKAAGRARRGDGQRDRATRPSILL
jgi:hypothetical protein